MEPGVVCLPLLRWIRKLDIESSEDLGDKLVELA